MFAMSRLWHLLNDDLLGYQVGLYEQEKKQCRSLPRPSVVMLTMCIENGFAFAFSRRHISKCRVVDPCWHQLATDAQMALDFALREHTTKAAEDGLFLLNDGNPLGRTFLLPGAE